MEYTAAQRLDRLPESRFHRRVATMIAAGLFFDTFDLYLASSVMAAFTSTGWATVEQNAQFASAGAFGALIGAFLAGWLGDLYGRKFSFQFNLLLFGGASLAAVFAPSMDWLIPLRFIMGIGLGAEIVVAYATITEFVPPARRGKWSAILFFAGTAALPTSNILGYLLIPAIGWRSMFAIAGFGAMFVWWMRKQLPESPRWLESKGHIKEAREILDRIEADVVKDTGAALPVPDVAASVSSTTKLTFGDLFKPNLLGSTITGMVLHIVALSSLYGFIVWLPTFLIKQGLSLETALGHAAQVSIGALVGVAAGAWWSDKWSRKRSIVLISIVSAVVGYIYANVGSIESAKFLGSALIALIYFSAAMGYSAYVPELFPTELRLRGTGISSMAGRAASIVAPQLVAVLFAANGVTAVTLVLVGLFLIQAVVIGLFGVETNSRSLESQFAARSGGTPTGERRVAADV
jgi:MFS transporter, putative metabolite:H+ symporter